MTIALMVHSVVAQKNFLKHFSLSGNTLSETSSLPPSNSVSQIVVQDSTIWIGTSKGAAKSITAGNTWISYRNDPSFANDGIFAIALQRETAWVATGYEKQITDGSVQTGSGYAVSSDGGSSWHHLGQTVDQRGDSILAYGINDSLWFLPVVVPEQNVTFDISLSPGIAWAASWAGGLRKSTNNGQTWQRIPLPPDDRNSLKPTDTLWTYSNSDTLKLHRIFQHFDPRRNNNFLAFSVDAVDNDTIWCGSAGGINKSTDGGLSWTKFNHQNQVAGILGDWVIAVRHQRQTNGLRVWTTNWKASGADEDYGVSYTDDGGRTWTNLLRGTKAYDISFKDSIVYIPTDDGIYRTADGGLSFTLVSSITDPSSHALISTSQAFAVDVLQDTVFAGTGDGLASTIDNAQNAFGSSWKIYRAYQQVGATGQSYAYPNPFAPNSEVVRIHYAPVGAVSKSQNTTTYANESVNIDIFDFGMNRVKTLLSSAQRELNREYDEVWDGRNDNGIIVANGVYFYRIKLGGSELYGKILVIQ